jgi:acetyltransferase-like isoleucine patch superfamily enzyme
MIRDRAKWALHQLVQAARRARYDIKEPSVGLGADVEFDNPSKITLGTRVKIGRGSRLVGRVAIGANTTLRQAVLLNAYGGHITIGQNCSINDFCVLYGMGGLTIGNDVRIATHTVIVSGNHNIEDLDRPIREQGVRLAAVTIEDDVWIAANVTILAGVQIGTGSVIGAGAVVTRSIPPRSIAVGAPAKVIRKRE